MDPVRQNPIWLTCKPLQRMCNNRMLHITTIRNSLLMFPLTPDQHHWLEVATEDEGWCSFTSCTPSRSRARTHRGPMLFTHYKYNIQQQSEDELSNNFASNRKLSTRKRTVIVTANSHELKKDLQQYKWILWIASASADELTNNVGPIPSDEAEWDWAEVHV